MQGLWILEVENPGGIGQIKDDIDITWGDRIPFPSQNDGAHGQNIVTGRWKILGPVRYDPALQNHMLGNKEGNTYSQCWRMHTNEYRWGYRKCSQTGITGFLYPPLVQQGTYITNSWGQVHHSFREYQLHEELGGTAPTDIIDRNILITQYSNKSINHICRIRWWYPMWRTSHSHL